MHWDEFVQIVDCVYATHNIFIKQLRRQDYATLIQIQTNYFLSLIPYAQLSTRF